MAKIVYVRHGDQTSKNQDLLWMFGSNKTDLAEANFPSASSISFLTSHVPL